MGIGSVYFNYETIPEQFYNVSKAFNTQNDTLGGFHEGLTGIPAFQDTYYAHILSLNATRENDIYTVSGLDASTLPNIAYIQPNYKHLWRKGKWTEEEEVYTKKLIEVFNSGYLRIPSGTTLRSFLSEKLCCDPMRITKKFSGSSCIGKQVYNCCDPSVTKEIIQESQDQLAILEKNFLSKVEQFGPSVFQNTSVPQYSPTPTYPVSAQAAPSVSTPASSAFFVCFPHLG